MTTRVEAVRVLQKDFMLMKQALMAVPPHPDFQPPQPPADPSQMQGAAPPPGGPVDPSQMQGAAPPPGGPVDPAMMQGAPPAPGGPVDPAMQQGTPPPQGEAPLQAPAVPSEIAAIMDKVVKTVETQGRQFSEIIQQQEQRMQKLEAELQHDKSLRDERKKVINTLLPAL